MCRYKEAINNNQVLKKRHNLDLDLVLLNHGGIRAPLPKGPIKMKTAFNIMPFENKVVIAQMKGTALMELVDYLRKAKRAHPISGMKLAAQTKVAYILSSMLIRRLWYFRMVSLSIGRFL